MVEVEAAVTSSAEGAVNASIGVLEAVVVATRPLEGAMRVLADSAV